MDTLSDINLHIFKLCDSFGYLTLTWDFNVFTSLQLWRWSENWKIVLYFFKPFRTQTASIIRWLVYVLVTGSLGPQDILVFGVPEAVWPPDVQLWRTDETNRHWDDVCRSRLILGRQQVRWELDSADNSSTSLLPCSPSPACGWNHLSARMTDFW